MTGIRWTLMASIATNGVRVAVLAVLGRNLSPEDFGVVAIALTVIVLGQRIKDLGVGVALVQRKEIELAHVQATFGVSLLLGVGLTLATLALAEPIATFYDLPEATDPLRVLGALFLLRGVSSTSQFLCQRDLRFRALSIIDTVSYVAGSATSVVMALQDFGPWALVCGYVVETAFGAALLLVLRPPPVAPRIQWKALRELLGFGGGQTLAWIANYFATQGDYIVVGRYLDASALGFYTRAFELTRFPAMLFQSIAGGVLFSSFARLQDDPERLGQAFRRILFANATVLLPVSAGLCVLAPEVITLLMGAGWESAILPFRVMALTILFQTSSRVGSMVAKSSADVFRLAWYHLLYAVAVVGGALVSVRWGIVGVSCSTGLAIIFHFACMTNLSLRRFPIGWRVVLRAHVGGLVLAALTVAGAAPVAALLRAPSRVDPLAVLGIIAAGGVLPIAYVIWRISRRSDDWTWLWQTLLQMLGRRRRAPRAG